MLTYGPHSLHEGHMKRLTTILAFALAFAACNPDESATCDYSEAPDPAGQTCAAQEDCQVDGACFDSRCLAGVCVVGVFVEGTPCDDCDTIRTCNNVGECVDPIIAVSDGAGR